MTWWLIAVAAALAVATLLADFCISMNKDMEGY